MGFVLHLTPPAGLLTWTPQQLAAFLASSSTPLRLGSEDYVNQAATLISSHLEHPGEPTRFPVLHAREAETIIGWELSQLPALIAELHTIRAELTAIHVSRETLFLPSQKAWLDFERQTLARKRPLPTTLAEHLAPYLRNFESAAQQAIDEGNGLLLTLS